MQSRAARTAFGAAAARNFAVLCRSEVDSDREGVGYLSACFLVLSYQRDGIESSRVGPCEQGWMGSDSAGLITASERNGEAAFLAAAPIAELPGGYA